MERQFQVLIGILTIWSYCKIIWHRNWFQVLIGSLTIRCIYRRNAWLSAVSSPYRYSNNKKEKNSLWGYQKVSSPYRYSNNVSLCLSSFLSLIVSSPYRYSNNLIDPEGCHLTWEVSSPYRYSNNFSCMLFLAS